MMAILALTLNSKTFFLPEPKETDAVKHIIRLREKLEWENPSFPRSLKYSPKITAPKHTLKVQFYSTTISTIQN